MFDFPLNQTTLIQGVNESDRGQKSNGSGKSHIIEALAYSLVGSPLKKVKDKELVMDGEKESSLRLVLDNPVTKQSFEISRSIFSNTKSATLDILGENDITSVNEGNQFILNSLGLSRDDILNYFLLSKERYVSFFSSSDTAKKELINRFSKADQLNPVIESCDEDVKHYSDEVSHYTNKIESNKIVLSSLKESQGSNNDSLIRSIKDESKVSQNRLNELKPVISQKEIRLSNIKDELERAKNVVKEHEPSIKAIRDSIKEYQEFLDEIERHFNNEVECPKCSHTFSLKDDKFSLEEAKKVYPQIKDSIADLMTEKQLKEEALNSAESSLQSTKTQYNNTEFELNKLINEHKICTRNIEQNITRIDELSKPINNTDKLEGLEKSIKEFEAKLSESKTNLSIANEWLLRFKRFKGWLANKSLLNIESHTNFYLEKLESDLRIEITGYTPVKNGKELREKISTKVFRNGNEASFARFSGGEKARIEIAVILAMQHIINQSTDGKGLDLIVLDEILDSCDSLGISLICKALNRLKRNVIIITQIEMESRYDNIMIVKKIMV